MQLEDFTSEPEEPLTDNDGGAVALLGNQGEDDVSSEEDNLQTTLPHPPVTYQCGCGPCKPKWLQNIVSAKLFTALLCVYSLIEGTMVNGEFLKTYLVGNKLFKLKVDPSRTIYSYLIQLCLAHIF